MLPLRFLFSLIVSLLSFSAFAQLNVEVEIPPFDDQYSHYVQQLEDGETDIDYQAFRFSFIESEQFKIATKKAGELNDLKKQMYAHMSNDAYEDIIKTTKKMLSIDYTNMLAHKILRQTYEILSDGPNVTKYKNIQFGLLNSIVKNGDGQSCTTGWSVIQVSEEYFILEMVGAKLKKQSLYKKGGICDKMDVKVDGKKKSYYFDVSKVFEGYKALYGE